VLTDLWFLRFGAMDGGHKNKGGFYFLDGNTLATGSRRPTNNCRISRDQREQRRFAWDPDISHSSQASPQVCRQTDPKNILKWVETIRLCMREDPPKCFGWLLEWGRTEMECDAPSSRLLIRLNRGCIDSGDGPIINLTRSCGKDTKSHRRGSGEEYSLRSTRPVCYAYISLEEMRNNIMNHESWYNNAHKLSLGIRNTWPSSLEVSRASLDFFLPRHKSPGRQKGFLSSLFSKDLLPA